MPRWLLHCSTARTFWFIESRLVTSQVLFAHGPILRYTGVRRFVLRPLTASARNRLGGEIHIRLHPDGKQSHELGVNRVFAIYQILLGWKASKYCYETDEPPNRRPTQSKKKLV